MKHLNEYINEQLVNETLKEKAKKIWKWLWGNDKDSDRLNNIFGDDVEGCALRKNKDSNSKRKYNIDKSKLTFESINSLAVLNQYIDVSHQNKDSNTGFWLFKEALDKDAAYGKINNEPWYIQYEALIDNIKDKTQPKNRYGLVSYSTKYNDSEDTLHIFDVQIDSEFRGNNLFETILNHLKDIAHKNNKKFISLRIYEKNLEKFYENHGFKKSNKYKNLMILPLNY